MDPVRIFTNELASGVAAKYGLKPVAQRARFWDHSGDWKHYDGTLMWLVIGSLHGPDKPCNPSKSETYGVYDELYAIDGVRECCQNCVELLPEFLYSPEELKGVSINV